MPGRDEHKHHRRSVRLKGYDYASPGVYFVTVVTQDRACLFGEVEGGEMRLNGLGEIVAEEWERTAMIRPSVVVDDFVVMPNHLHGILILTEATGDGGAVARAHGSAPLPDPDVGCQPRPHGSDDPSNPPVGAHCRAPNSGPPDASARNSGEPGPFIEPERKAIGLARAPQSLGSIVAGFKAASTRRINSMRATPRAPVWQRNYFEHIVRNDIALERVREYILANPSCWPSDRL